MSPRAFSLQRQERAGGRWHELRGGLSLVEGITRFNACKERNLERELGGPHVHAIRLVDGEGGVEMHADLDALRAARRQLAEAVRRVSA